jgi:hypothetical protein
MPSIIARRRGKCKQKVTIVARLGKKPHLVCIQRGKHRGYYVLGGLNPHSAILLKYARAAGVSIDVLVDHELDLPKARKRK